MEQKLSEAQKAQEFMQEESNVLKGKVQSL
jgi:hypothetical protein